MYWHVVAAHVVISADDMVVGAHTCCLFSIVVHSKYMSLKLLHFVQVICFKLLI